jgi:hypothetical protein
MNDNNNGCNNNDTDDVLVIILVEVPQERSTKHNDDAVIRSRVATNAYCNGWDRVFPVKNHGAN